MPEQQHMPPTSKRSFVGRPGQPRLPILDTRHPRVHLSRTLKYTQNRAESYKAISVISVQTLWRKGKAETAYTTVGQVSERGYQKRAKQTIRQFYQLLDDALAIGHFIDREIARGRYPKSFLRIADLPEGDQEVKGCWDYISLPVLLDSYTLEDPELQPTTTFGDPEAITVELQKADLREPRRPVALNGHHLKFKQVGICGDTFYLPTGICRLRHGWRLFIRHSEGTWSDEIADEPGSLLESSLREAWMYFVSQLRVLAPPKAPLAPISVQRCYTGIEGGTFLIGHRHGHWRFQLRYGQKMRSGRRFATTVRYWREDTLTEAGVRFALCHLAAMDAYYKHLSSVETTGDVRIDRDTTIPGTFWPAEPVIPISADDLRYEVETREGPGGTAQH